MTSCVLDDTHSFIGNRLDVRFSNRELERLYEHNERPMKYPAEVVQTFRRRIRFLEAATNTMDLELLTCLEHAAVRGQKDMRSIGLTSGWHLLISEEDTLLGTMVTVHAIVKDHEAA